MTDEVEIVAQAVAELEPQEREQRWGHLSLCVLDAVFSINARYSTTVRTVRSYATAAEIASPLVRADEAADAIGSEQEEPLSTMLRRADGLGTERWAAEELHNLQRTSTTAGVLKAAAARDYAAVLVEAGIERLADASALLADEEPLRQVEARLEQVPGHGNDGVRLSYLWMLVGDDDLVKPDRMVLRWLSRVVERHVVPAEARELIAEVARRLGRSAWAIDHAIWTAERSR